MKVHKPLFSDVVALTKDWCSENGVALPYFNIEIKRRDGYDGQFHPGAQEFSQLVVEQVNELGIKKETYIQSFDYASLKATKEIDAEIKLVLLIGEESNIDENVKKLGFTPEVYSPYFKLIDEATVKYCKEAGMQLIPWTVNEVDDMKRQIELGVDGIITDYPDRLVALCNEQEINIK